MFEKQIKVIATRDDEAGVWFATSDDIGGLVVEAETLEALHEEVIAAIRDLVELGAFESKAPEIPVCIQAQQLQRITNPCAA